MKGKIMKHFVLLFICAIANIVCLLLSYNIGWAFNVPAVLFAVLFGGQLVNIAWYKMMKRSIEARA